MTTASNTPKSDEVVLGDKNVETSSYDRFKGQAGETYRLAFLSKTLTRGMVHYFNNRGYRCLSTPEKQAICCEHMGSAQQKFGLTLFQYTTDGAGDVVDPAKLQGKIKFWLITEARYEELTAIHKRWPLLDVGFTEKQCDLIAKCTENQFQKMGFTPCPDAHWKKNEEWYKQLKVKEAKAKEKLNSLFGRRSNDEELRVVLGISTGAGKPPTQGVDIDLSDVVETQGSEKK